MKRAVRNDHHAQAVATRAAGDRLALILSSYTRLTGRVLAPSTDALWSAPRAVLAHGLEPDPLFFYGNRTALDLFATAVEDFIGMPSRLSAEPMAREARARLLTEVARRGFIDDYAGVRISARGERFRIERATVWNLVDAEGRLHGQAATFDTWTPLG